MAVYNSGSSSLGTERLHEAMQKVRDEFHPESIPKSRRQRDPETDQSLNTRPGYHFTDSQKPTFWREEEP